jgi:hypothetical protein
MKYYVMRIKYQKDGVIKKSEVMDYDTLKKAEAKYHTNLGTDMEDDTLQGSMCTVINGAGGQEMSEFWGTMDIEPEPEPNE